jgi:methionyl-tRNA formyltransferase
MRVLLFSGSHSRHLFIHKLLLENFNVCGVVAMEREPQNVEPPLDLNPRDRDNFIRHFADRMQVERREFGSLSSQTVFSFVPTIYRTGQNLNSEETASFIKSCNADLAIILGVDLIKSPIFEVLPKDKINIHLGLSPWYRGSATLFWPFYNLEPQFCGATIHQIVPEADAGEIIHQIQTPLYRNDQIHDAGARTVTETAKIIVPLLKHREKYGFFVQQQQKITGRLYLTRHFRPEHLRAVYDLFENNIVNLQLDGQLGSHQPKIIRHPGI